MTAWGKTGERETEIRAGKSGRQPVQVSAILIFFRQMGLSAGRGRVIVLYIP